MTRRKVSFDLLHRAARAPARPHLFTMFDCTANIFAMLSYGDGDPLVAYDESADHRVLPRTMNPAVAMPTCAAPAPAPAQEERAQLRAACGKKQRRSGWRITREHLFGNMTHAERARLNESVDDLPSAKSAGKASKKKIREVREKLRKIRNVKSAQNHRARERDYKAALEQNVIDLNRTVAELRRERACCTCKSSFIPCL